MEELIQSVRKQRALWDTTALSYKDHTKRFQAWTTVSEECGLTLESAKSKWRGLRDTYTKFLKAQKRATDQGRRKRKTYCYAEQMAFMKPIMLNLKPRVVKEQEPSLDMWEEHNDELVAHTTIDSDHQVGADALLHTRLRQTTDSKSEAFDSLWLNSSTHGQMDAMDLMFLSYSKTMKTFSKRRQILLKRKFAEILSDAELEQVSEDESEFVSPFVSTLSKGNECKAEPN